MSNFVKISQGVFDLKGVAKVRYSGQEGGRWTFWGGDSRLKITLGDVDGIALNTFVYTKAKTWKKDFDKIATALVERGNNEK